ncbi:MAG: pilus assembly protein [Anaerolineales bacterium]|nr:pilus assembly protein [Anaerolineales bacterium]
MKIKTFLNSIRTEKSERAQSMVEFLIAIPVLILLLSGVVEFGFALNYYLSVLDATRYGARLGSDASPFVDDYGSAKDNAFYNTIYDAVIWNLDPSLDPQFASIEVGRRIPVDPSADDVIVSVYSTCNGAITTVESSSKYGNASTALNPADLQAHLVSGSPKAGILVVEVRYNFHQVLQLPWFTAVVPDPMPLTAYSIMPLRSAEDPDCDDT